MNIFLFPCFFLLFHLESLVLGPSQVSFLSSPFPLGTIGGAFYFVPSEWAHTRMFSSRLPSHSFFFSPFFKPWLALVPRTRWHHLEILFFLPLSLFPRRSNSFSYAFLNKQGLFCDAAYAALSRSAGDFRARHSLVPLALAAPLSAEPFFLLLIPLSPPSLLDGKLFRTNRDSLPGFTHHPFP